MHHANGDHQGYPLTEALLHVPAAPPPPRIDGIVIGTLSGFDADGRPCVAYPGCGAASLPARATTPLTPADRWREIALMFENGDSHKPIILGLIHQPAPALIEALVDDKKLVFTAEEAIEFRCGKASITLTKAGKILLRGEYLLSRSSGVNRIKGGSVQIN